MRLFPLFFCLFLSLVWPVIFNVSLLFIILVGCFYLDIMISIHAWAGYWANWINEIGFLVLLDFMPDLFYLGYVATMFFPVWTLLSRIFLFHHLDSFCMKLNDFEDWKEILGTGKDFWDRNSFGGRKGLANLIRYSDLCYPQQK